MLTLSEQVGQLLTIGFEGDCWNRGLEALLRRISPGGVIFFPRNIKTAPDFHGLAGQIRQHLKTPPFLAIDMEGGQVDRLRDALPPLPAVRDVARAGMAADMGKMAGRELAAFSLNVDFAPVLDLTSTESEDVLGNRTAGNSPEEVIRFAEEFLKGLAAAGVLGCGKHFPGLGGGQKDSHRELPCIRKAEADLWRDDLLPFRALANQLPMLMVSHASYPELEGAPSDAAVKADNPLPASLSHAIITGLLKERIGFQGLVLSDDLEMGAILRHRTIAEAAVEAVRAGCDGILVCRHASNVRKAFDALCQEASRNENFRTLVELASKKVLTAKKDLLTAEPPAAATLPDWDLLRREIREFADAVERRLTANPAGKEGVG